MGILDFIANPKGKGKAVRHEITGEIERIGVIPACGATTFAKYVFRLKSRGETFELSRYTLDGGGELSGNAAIAMTKEGDRVRFTTENLHVTQFENLGFAS